MAIPGGELRADVLRGFHGCHQRCHAAMGNGRNANQKRTSLGQDLRPRAVTAPAGIGRARGDEARHPHVASMRLRPAAGPRSGTRDGCISGR